MLSLGLDPSLTGFGWVVHDPNAQDHARVVKKGRFRTTARQIFVERYIFLRENVKALLDEFPEVSIVGVESPPFGESFSEGLYALFVQVNEAVFTRRRDVVYFDPTTVKFLAKEDPSFRKGRMFKADMMALAKADTGITRWNADEADAYHVARFAGRFYQLLENQIEEDVLLPSEKQVFLKYKTITRGEQAGQVKGTGVLFKEGSRFHRFSKLEVP